MIVRIIRARMLGESVELAVAISRATSQNCVRGWRARKVMQELMRAFGNPPHSGYLYPSPERCEACAVNRGGLACPK